MSQQIVLVSKGSSGAAQRLVLKPGQKVPAAPNQKYQVLVDGKEQLPEGSEVVRNGNDLEIRLANGDTVTLTNWAAAEGAIRAGLLLNADRGRLAAEVLAPLAPLASEPDPVAAARRLVEEFRATYTDVQLVDNCFCPGGGRIAPRAPRRRAARRRPPPGAGATTRRRARPSRRTATRRSPRRRARPPTPMRTRSERRRRPRWSPRSPPVPRRRGTLRRR